MVGEYIIVMGTISGVIIGFLLNWARDWIQNRPKIKVSLKFDDAKARITGDYDYMDIKLSAVNSRSRPVALINYELLVDDKIINFSLENAVFGYRKKKLILPSGDPLPYLLNEGQIYSAKINAFDLARILKKERYNGKVKLSGHYETAQDTIESSEPLSFNIDDFIPDL